MGQDKRCFAGTGVVDTDSFLQTLKCCGYDGMVSVETFRPEYWAKTPEWVIENAYRTTREALEDVYKRQGTRLRRERCRRGRPDRRRRNVHRRYVHHHRAALQRPVDC